MFSKHASELVPLILDLLELSKSRYLNWGWLAGTGPDGIYFENPRSSSCERINVLLYFAALIGNCDLIDAILSRGAQINAEGGENGTALHMAAYRGDSNVVEFLLDRGAEVNVTAGYFGSALQAAAFSCQDDTVALLITRGADVNASGGFYGTALEAAMQEDRGAESTINILLDAGAVFMNTDDSIIEEATIRGMKKLVARLLEKADFTEKACGQALQNALVNGYTDLAELFISKGASVTAPGGQYHHPIIAAMMGGLPVLQYLVDKHNFDPTMSVLEGKTALHFAVYKELTDITLYLLEIGSDVNQEDMRGWSAIHYAALSTTPNILKLLLPHWSFKEGRDLNKWTPLHLACRRNTFEAVSLLLEAGLTPTIIATKEPEWQWTLYDIAVIYDNQGLLGNATAAQLNLLDADKRRDERLASLKASTHGFFACDGCVPFDIDNEYIIGPVFHCKECPDFDYCFMCYLTAHKSHQHSSWTIQ